MGRHRATGWEPAFFAAMASGATLGEATAQARIGPHIVRWRRDADPEFAEMVASYRPRLRTSARRTGSRALTEDTAARLLDGLRAGRTLKDACADAGIAVPTMKRARRVDYEFDTAIVTAAAAGGTTLTWYPRHLCPGKWCGTVTGYGYGCSRDPCRAATAARAARDRRRRRSDPPDSATPRAALHQGDVDVP